MIVVDVAVHTHLEPVVAEGEAQALIQAKSTGAVLNGFLSAALIDIADVVGQTRPRIRICMEMLIAAEGCIEVECSAGIPVAIDILRPCDTPARQFVVFSPAADSILRSVERGVGGIGTLQVGNILIVTGVHVLGKGGFQARISQADIQRVSIAEGVWDKVGDAWLAH